VTGVQTCALPIYPEHDQPIDDIILQDAEEAIRDAKAVKLSYKVDNTNRSIATKVSGEIAYQYGEEGLPEGTLELDLTGTAGQSFGAFLAPGVKLVLTGEGNDYVGKSMSGGEIIVRPLPGHRFVPEKNSIIGNTVMYGAIRGEAFFSGVAGERFAVRLSGATAVVEGTGDHGCEYMTGGTVAVLGKTGRNFAAGMSGGVAYVYDEDGQFVCRCNTCMVSMEKVLTVAEQEASVDRKVWHRDQADETQLKKLLEDHHKWTGSQRARELLDNWAQARLKFVKVFPNEYKRALGEINARKAAAKSTDSVAAS